MLRRRSAACPLVLVVALAAAWLSIASLAAPADAHVETVATKGGGPNITVGIQHREAARYWDGIRKLNGLGKSEVEENPAAAEFGNASGHEVVHTANTYAIYWDPQDYYHGDWQGLVDGFLANLGIGGGQLSSVFAVDRQYTDKTNKPATSNSVFHGAYTDTHPYPEAGNCTDPHPLKFGIPLLQSNATICLTAAQVLTELERFIKQREEEHHNLPKGMGTIFYILTPPGLTVCLDEGGAEGHCSDFNGTTNEIGQYEERATRFPEEVVTYEKEQEVYEKAQKKYEAELINYEKEKTKLEGEGKAEEKEPPVKPTKPVKPVKPVEPAGYVDYKKSFCSYHGAAGAGANTLLYGVIPWTAGGNGDYHLSGLDQTSGFACQDGGFEPGSKPTGEVEEKEREKPESPLEKEEFEQKTKGEQREELEAKEAGLAKPHEQEPNQLSGVGADGSYDTGLADLIINQIAVEQQNIITNPLLNAWQDPAGNEVTDECRNFFVPARAGSASAKPTTLAGTLSNEVLGGANYYLNIGYNLAGLARLHPGVEYPGLPFPGVVCPNGVRLEPQFTAPNTVKGGEVVGFDGMESVITLNSAVRFSAGGSPQPNYGTYTWNFGDETPEVSGFAPGAPACEEPWLSSCAASVFHAYKYSGTYEVTLTVKDVGGDEAHVTKSVTVVEGEPRPALPPATPPAPQPATPGPSSGGASGAGSGTTTKSFSAPVASAVIASHSLKSVLAKGLVVRYSVNQQVAGRFEVLLASSIARRIGLHGPPATGLPKGSPAQIVIAKAVLVTTKGGHSTVRILFGKTTAARLRRLHKVSLTVRLVVRNASANSPASTTVVSVVTLTH
jgi:PKD domain